MALLVGASLGAAAAMHAAVEQASVLDLPMRPVAEMLAGVS
jgi:hypothetical protein